MSSSTATSFPITRLYTGPDGESYFENLSIPLSNSTIIGQLSDSIPSSLVQFRWTEPSYDLQLHNAPRRQYIVMVQGGVIVTTSLGESRTFQSGVLEQQVLLVEDTNGRGHRSKALNGKGRFSIFIGLAES